MAKVLIVTYKEIRGFKYGRHETDEAIVYSDFHGRNKYARILNVDSEQADESVNEFLKELQDIDKAYVYVGLDMMQSAGRLMSDLKSLGKDVSMVACDCDYREKKIFAGDFGVRLINADCGGYMLYDQVIKDIKSS